VSIRNLLFVFLAACLMPALAGSAVAHHHEMGMFPMWGMASDQEIDRSLDALQQALNLTPAQKDSVRELVQSRREAMQSIRAEARPKFQRLMTLLDQPAPDPTAVGRAAIDFKAVHERAKAQRADAEKRFLSLLNPTQMAVVQSIRTQAPVFRAMQRLGFLPPPEFHPETLTSEAAPPPAPPRDASAGCGGK